MAVPTFVTAGAGANNAFGSNVTPGLPGSRSNGNILIAVVTSAASGAAKRWTWSSGWTEFDFISTTGVSMAAAWRLVDGSEAAPTATFTAGNSSMYGRVYQYAGEYGADPFGATHHNNVNSATVTDAGVTTTRANSLVLSIMGGDTGVQSFTTPSGFTLDQAAAGANGGSLVAFSISEASAGSTTGSISSTAGSSSQHGAFTWELCSVSTVVDLDLDPTNHGLGVSEAATVTTIANPTSTHALGVSMAAAIEKDVSLSAAPSLGIDMAAAVQLEEDESAAVALGVSMSAALIAILSVSASGNLGVTMAAHLSALVKPPQPVIIVAS